MEILQIDHVSFRYPQADRQVLKDICADIHAGEFVVICGQSGCGKSTLLRLLKRELSPHGERDGTIRYQGELLDRLDDRTAASDIGFVLQDPDNQIVTDTVWHELAFGLESLATDSQVIRRRVAEMASYFGMEEWFEKSITELSGGQKQLLNLAGVMVMGPKVLLLDEPTAQLDPIAASNFIAALEKLNRELGLTVVLAEHRLEDVFPIADRVWILEDTRLAFDGPPDTVHSFFRSRPSHPMAEALPTAMRIFGDEAIDRCPITVREGREYLMRHYACHTDSLEQASYRHSQTAAVALKNVRFRYERDFPDVIKGLTLEVYEGEHVCLLGSNGTGKTTLLGIMAGLLRPYSGNVRIDGQSRGAHLFAKRLGGRVALLPQDPKTVFLEQTVEEDLLVTCRRLSLDTDEATKCICDTAAELGITHLMGRHPYDLSGGEQQKAALAKMLLLQPTILLLDEPTKGIDAHAKRELIDVLKRLQRDGITVITVTHDVEFAAASADRCGLLFGGELVSQGVPCEFFTDNSFYTTAANRLSRGYYKNAVLCEQVQDLCRINGKKAVRE